MKPRRKSPLRVYATPAAVVTMGAVWMWHDLGTMRGAVIFCAGVIVISVLLGLRSDRRTRRRLAETQRQMDLLRTGGLGALEADLQQRSKKDAA